MRTSYEAQIDSEKGEYEIQFKTTNYDYYKMVERLLILKEVKK